MWIYYENFSYCCCQYASELIKFVSRVRIILVTLLGAYLYLNAIVAYKFGKGTYCVSQIVMMVVVPAAMAVTLMTAITTYP
jgi:hypothetical protein